MSRHESEDPRDRIEETARELRQHRPRPSEALVSRIERLAERRSTRTERTRIPWFSRRRMVFALGTALVLAVVGGVAFGELGQSSKSPLVKAKPALTNSHAAVGIQPVTTSGESKRVERLPATGTIQNSAKARKSTEQDLPAMYSPLGGTPSTSSTSSAAPLTGSERLAEQRATLIVKVGRGQLSSATKNVERITRSLGGYLVSARYSVPKRGTATSRLKLKVPAAKAPEALTRISALGDILSQRVSFKDLQNTVNNESDQIKSLTKRINELVAALEDPTLAASARAKLQVELTNDRIERNALRARRKANIRTGQMATISLTLRTSDLPEPPDRPSRIHKAIDRAWNGLSSEISWAAIGLIVAAPFLALALIGVPAMRIRRRHEEQRLLEK
jgi:hypothetical protein